MLAFALTACSDKDNKKVATQVAARVGSQEISVHQINQMLSRANPAGLSPQGAQAMRKDVLEKLIDQQLAVGQATEKKLDRSPEVVAQLEAARREVLARAYIQQVVGALPKPGADEQQKYYTDHPQLFAQRRIFNLQEILVPAAALPVAAEPLKALVNAGKSMEEMAVWLKGREIKFTGGAATRAAEQIPLDLLPKVHALKDGQAAIIESTQGLTVVRLVSSQPAPVTQANALPRIEQFLSNQRGAEAVTKTIKELRAKDTITYMGDFAKTADAVTPATPVNAVARSAEPPATSGGASASTAIEKGIAGLK